MKTKTLKFPIARKSAFKFEKQSAVSHGHKSDPTSTLLTTATTGSMTCPR